MLHVHLLEPHEVKIRDDDNGGYIRTSHVTLDFRFSYMNKYFEHHGVILFREAAVLLLPCL